MILKSAPGGNIGIRITEEFNQNIYWNLSELDKLNWYVREFNACSNQEHRVRLFNYIFLALSIINSTSWISTRIVELLWFQWQLLQKVDKWAIRECEELANEILRYNHRLWKSCAKPN